MSNIGLCDEGPPANSDLATVKRKRKTLACSRCRRQKLRCDRTLPVCGRCRVAGQANSCIYETSISDGQRQEPGGQEVRVGGDNTNVLSEDASRSYAISQSANARPATASERASIFDTNRGQIISVDGPEVVSQQDRWPDISREPLQDRQPSDTWRGHGLSNVPVESAGGLRTQPAESMIFRGRLFATQFCGVTHPVSFIAHFPDLQQFMVNAISRDSSLAQVQRSLKSLELQWKQAKLTVVERRNVDLTRLIQLLPDQLTADQLIQTYWATFESTYHILYAPSFWADYQLLWTNPTAAPAGFVVTVLLAMASVRCVVDQEKMTYMGDSSSYRESAIAWIDLCESWIELQSKKRLDLSYWQCQCLLLLAKISNTVKKKETWTIAGNLMRLAMSAGFHRDPGLLRPKMSQLNQEIRRRLWATMVELELQVSIDRGMPSSAANVFCDSANVLNVNDEDIGESGQHGQTQQPWHLYTSSSFLHLSKRSLHLRSSLNALINGLEVPLIHDDVLRYDKDITQLLDEISSCGSTPTMEGSQLYPELPKALLDVQLRQFLLLLHTPFAIKSDSSARHSLSRLACLNAASTIIDKYSRLPVVACNALRLTRTDLFRSALIICQVVSGSQKTHRDELPLLKLGDTLHDYVKTTLDKLGDTITTLGTGYTHYWYLSAAYGLLKSQASPANAEVEQKIAIDRVIKQYYKVLASQEDMSASEARSRYRRAYGLNSKDVDLVAQGDMAFAGTSSPNAQIPLMSFDMDPPDPELEQYFFGDPAAWTFQNLW